MILYCYGTKRICFIYTIYTLWFCVSDSWQKLFCLCGNSGSTCLSVASLLLLLLSHFSCVRLCVTHRVSSTTRLPCPWDSPGKNTGVGCHRLLRGLLYFKAILCWNVSSPKWKSIIFLRALFDDVIITLTRDIWVLCVLGHLEYL